VQAYDTDLGASPAAGRFDAGALGSTLDRIQSLPAQGYIPLTNVVALEAPQSGLLARQGFASIGHMAIKEHSGTGQAQVDAQRQPDNLG